MAYLISSPRRATSRGPIAATIAAILLLLVQSGLGVAANLYVAVPKHHSGARPKSYLSGSFHSVLWAIVHSAPTLAVHATLGIALVLVALLVVARSWRTRRPGVTALALLAALLVLGAGFNGASFLDFEKNVSSLIMALLAFGAVGCYSLLLWVLTSL